MTTTNNVNNSFGGQLSITKTNIGSATSLFITNNDNSDSASHSYAKVESGGASGGDAQVTLYNSVAYTSLGLDNSDGDSLVISRSDALGTTNYARCDTTGNWTYPSNTTFSVRGNSGVDISNIVGDGTASTYLVPFTASVFNINSTYDNGTYVFTVPISGIYYFSGQCSITGFSNLIWLFALIKKNGSTILSNEFGVQYYGRAVYYAVPLSGIYKCDAGDTLSLYIVAYDLAGKIGDTKLFSNDTWFTGVLLA
jgi:hypothetical protein